MFLRPKVTLAFPVKYLKSCPETRSHFPTLLPLPYRMAFPEALERRGVLDDLFQPQDYFCFLLSLQILLKSSPRREHTRELEGFHVISIQNMPRTLGALLG
jgi:hypothetical protein